MMRRPQLTVVDIRGAFVGVNTNTDTNTNKGAKR